MKAASERDGGSGAPGDGAVGGPRTFRPGREPVQWSEVRELTLGDVVDRARRHGHFAAVVLLIAVVAVWFPGDAPISRTLTPSGGSVADPGGGGPLLGESDTEVLDDALGLGSDRSPIATTGGLAGPTGGTDFAFDLEDFDDDLGGDDTGTGDDGGGEGEAPASCAADEHLPDPVVTPTLEQAETAQTALEEGIGQPFPIDVTTLAQPLCDAMAGAEGAGVVIGLGGLVSRDDAVLLQTLDPVIAPSCRHVRSMALIEALTTRSLSPALADAAALCVAAADATPEPSAGTAGDGDVPGPTVPETSDPDVPSEPTDPSEGPIQPIWQPESPID